MITININAHPTAVEALIWMLAQRGYTPSPLILTGSDGRTLELTPAPYYQDWTQGMRMAWANRPALDGGKYRWAPEQVTVAAPDEWQAEIDAGLQHGAQKWGERWTDTYLDMQVTRWLNGVREDDVLRTLETLTEDELQQRIATIRAREGEREE